VDIPPDVQIKAILKPGSVFYFDDAALSSSEPHFFIVINKTPISDHLLLLVCSSTKIAKTKYRSLNYPPSTLVEVSPSEYPDFSQDSIIDCNRVFPRSVQQLINKLSDGKLKLKSEMPGKIVILLRQGVLDSPLVEEALKRIIR
jgi:hypothetical protein